MPDVNALSNNKAQRDQNQDFDEMRQIIRQEMQNVQAQAASRVQVVTNTWVEGMTDELMDNMDENSCYLMLLGTGGVLCVLWVMIVGVWFFVATPDSGLPLQGLDHKDGKPEDTFTIDGKEFVKVLCSNPHYAYDKIGNRYKVDLMKESMTTVINNCTKGAALVDVPPEHLKIYYRKVEGALPNFLLWGSPALACVLLAASFCFTPHDLDFAARNEDTNKWINYRNAKMEEFNNLHRNDKPPDDLKQQIDEAWGHLKGRNGSLTTKSRLSDSLKKRVNNQTAVDAFLEICAKKKNSQFKKSDVKTWIPADLENKWNKHEKNFPPLISFDAFIDVWKKFGVKKVSFDDDDKVTLTA